MGQEVGFHFVLKKACIFYISHVLWYVVVVCCEPLNHFLISHRHVINVLCLCLKCAFVVSDEKSSKCALQ